MDPINTGCCGSTKEVSGSSRVKEYFSKTVIYLCISLRKIKVCLGNYSSLRWQGHSK